MGFLLRFLLILCTGFLGAAFFVGVFPFLRTSWPLKDIPAFAEFGSGATTIERTERIIVEEHSAFQDAVARQKSGVLAARAVGDKGELAYTSALALTSDGLVVSPFSLVRKDAKRYSIRGEHDWLGAELIAADSARGLALFRVQGGQFSPAAFGNQKDLALGQTVFMLSMPQEGHWRVERSTIQQTASDMQSISFSSNAFSSLHTGVGLFSLDGKLFGMLVPSQEKEPKLISSQIIEDFLHEVLQR